MSLLRKLFSGDGLRSELEQMRRNRDYWRDYAIEAAEQVRTLYSQNLCQQENYAFAHAKAEELREALRRIVEFSPEEQVREFARAALGEEAPS